MKRLILSLVLFAGLAGAMAAPSMARMAGAGYIYPAHSSVLANGPWPER
jgi:hypothetical protein